MTVRGAHADLRILTLAAVLVVPLMAAGCTSSPEPYFGWDTQSAPRKVAVAKPKPRPRYNDTRYNDTRYNDTRYNDTRYDGSRYADNRATCNCSDAPVPTARPRPKWSDPADRDDGYRDDYDNSAVRFQWPVRGRVVTEFGSSPGGERSNGIDIAATDREPIRAAAEGTVSYSGNEVRGYGNLVLIRHADRYVTAYAHADEFVVAKGQWVARGQVIGYVGMTGDVGSPRLHFEIRRGSRGETPIDPRRMLGSMQVANR
jgi:murein DD-endopeptidase MepM/ murein hydrolase activator NlpD